ncbi:GNAT family N-acetyltransferase [Rhizobium sp. SL42]|uniref:GNAT family N-acetyltransferase n=1 Tax=Rhizobium sp. SL42 TaxID=2806346 RepID=UPI001F2E97B3|nr:GNAT family N-acetyltransferase [Rhizobium sp. SL42]UJW75940.1 GNAT family N-acetyltransferase [Rhizobium sp. SL42]
MKHFDPAISAATSLIDRFKAVDFVMRIPPYSGFADVRRKRAITYAIERTYHAIDFTDAEADGGFVVRRGGYDAPIFTCHLSGELVGALVCSSFVPGLPVRIMMLAVSEAHRGAGIAQALVQAAVTGAPVVGVAPPDGLRGFYERLGFTHWYRGAGGADVGFTRSIDERTGLYYVVPVATDDEIADGNARLKMEAHHG